MAVNECNNKKFRINNGECKFTSGKAAKRAEEAFFNTNPDATASDCDKFFKEATAQEQLSMIINDMVQEKSQHNKKRRKRGKE